MGHFIPCNNILPALWRLYSEWGRSADLLLFYILATTKVISRRVPTCDSAFHSDFIVLPNCETRPPAPWPDIHIIVTLSWCWPNQPLLYPNNAECLTGKQQVSIIKSLVWFDQGSNPWGSDSPISQSGRWMLYSFGQPIWSGVRKGEGSNLQPLSHIGLDWVAKWVERPSPILVNLNLVGGNPGRVKPMTLKFIFVTS